MSFLMEKSWGPSDLSASKPSNITDCNGSSAIFPRLKTGYGRILYRREQIFQFQPMISFGAVHKSRRVDHPEWESCQRILHYGMCHAHLSPSPLTLAEDLQHTPDIQPLLGTVNHTVEYAFQLSTVIERQVGAVFHLVDGVATRK